MSMTKLLKMTWKTEEECVSTIQLLLSNWTISLHLTKILISMHLQARNTRLNRKLIEFNIFFHIVADITV